MIDVSSLGYPYEQFEHSDFLEGDLVTYHTQSRSGDPVYIFIKAGRIIGDEDVSIFDALCISADEGLVWIAGEQLMLLHRIVG